MTEQTENKVKDRQAANIQTAPTLEVFFQHLVALMPEAKGLPAQQRLVPKGKSRGAHEVLRYRRAARQVRQV
jgi:hypothetical protein